MDNEREAVDISVKGIVQGVGFRPFVYRLAQEEGITGWVLNDVAGVTIHAEGTPEAIDRFIVRLSSEEPPAAKVSEIDIAEAPVQGYASFAIQASDSEEDPDTTLISPDLGICAQCNEELLDPNDRRFRYPFINCTNCGPRFTIIDQLPYDRPNTSMAGFTMCDACQAEYDDPANRRFHAQPNACFICGPSLGFAEVPAGSTDPVAPEAIEWAQGREASDALIARCVTLLREGKIVAVKGLGGYHLVCDAANPEAIATLRARKRRPAKPLAVMAADADQAAAQCLIDDAERAVLESPARPIVLLRKRSDAKLVAGLADGVHELGVMLPATPVQVLLAHDFGGLLVMTSGNAHDDPICITEEEALSQLSGIADAFLVNDRPIVARYDDSVLRVLHPAEVEDGAIQMIRRARGYAPTAIPLDRTASAQPEAEGADGNGTTQPALDLLAVGSQQKNTFTLTREDKAFVSQHMGDMDNTAQLDAWDQAVRRYEALFQIAPTEVRCDLHPDYVLSKQAKAALESGDEALSAPGGFEKLVEVQHHFAHLLSVLGEQKLEPPVCGFVFDGTGYGYDGAIWGGEVLLANYADFERFANLAYFPLPGGAAAVTDPCRSAFGLLWACDLLEEEAAQRFASSLDPALIEAMTMQVEQGMNAPSTSSMGRLFDAVAALTGICRNATYDGQPAIELENALWDYLAKSPADDASPDEASQAKAPVAAEASAAPDAAETADDAEADVTGDAPEGEAPAPAYEFAIIKNVASKDSTAHDTSVILLDPQSVIAAILADLSAGVAPGAIAKRFHDAVVDAVVVLARFVRSGFEIASFALTGGVFQNRYLAERCIDALVSEGFAVALNIELPPNDGNVSFGQAVLA